LDNYKIGPALNKTSEYIIIYKSPAEDTWRVIGRHSDKNTAIQTLHNLIEFLRKLSIESEGFHMLEHVLLRPEVDQPAFGFRFCSGPDEVLFQNDQWTGFEEREQIFSEIEAAAEVTDPTKTTNISNTAPVIFQIKKAGQTNTWQKVSVADIADAKQQQDIPEIKAIRAELKKLNQNNTRMFPRFELMVRLPNGEIVPEDLYNMQVTIALPSWPARFQDKDFRSFAENQFRSMAPAYLRLQFRWLGVSRMKKFEELYSPWLESFRTRIPYEDRNKIASSLSLWLMENNSPQN
jgi:hypothetical protein